MKLLIVDPNVSITSPSMKGAVLALPQLRAAGFEIDIWCWDCDDDIVGAHIVRLPRFGRMRVLASFAFSFWARLRRWWHYDVQKRSRPDVIYTIAWYLPECDVCHVHFSPWDWQRRQRDLGIHSLRDLYEAATGLLGRWQASQFMRKTTANTLLAVSHAVAEDLREVTPPIHASIRVLPNSYDAARFHSGVREEWRENMRAKLGYETKEAAFIFVSTGHYRRKGFFLAVSAVASLRARAVPARFLVVGGRDSRIHELQAWLDKKHPDWRDWITFTGDVPDVERYFAAADGMLFPSYSEAFALVEIEAAACGLPLFLTRHHGSEMILEEGVNGRYLEFDSEKIADVLTEFVHGRWKPAAANMRHALKSEDYATCLINFLHESAAPLKSDPVRNVLPQILS